MELNWKRNKLLLRNFPVTSLQLVKEKVAYKYIFGKKKTKATIKINQDFAIGERKGNISTRRAANTHTKTKKIKIDSAASLVHISIFTASLRKGWCQSVTVFLHKQCRHQ